MGANARGRHDSRGAASRRLRRQQQTRTSYRFVLCASCRLLDWLPDGFERLAMEPADVLGHVNGGGSTPPPLVEGSHIVFQRNGVEGFCPIRKSLQGVPSMGDGYRGHPHGKWQMGRQPCPWHAKFLSPCCGPGCKSTLAVSAELTLRTLWYVLPELTAYPLRSRTPPPSKPKDRLLFPLPSRESGSLSPLFHCFPSE